MKTLFNSLIRIDKTKKCFMCKHKFKDGILNKFPKERRPFMDFLKGEFLYHLKETHAIEPMDFVNMLLK